MGSLRKVRQQRRPFLQVEQLESRLVPSGVQPTAVEQLFLEELNDARANPAAYGNSIGLDLSSVPPSQPLAWDPLLGAAALGHSQDMNTNNYFGHIDSSGLNPGQRIANAGYNTDNWAESIAAGYTDDADALAGLIIDAGVPGFGHRVQLLSIGATNQVQSEVGIGIVLNGTGQYVDYYTIDTAQPTAGGVFLTGSVFNDLAGTGQYAIGEGLGGVTINVAGVGSTTSFGSGGYTIQVPPGTYSVTASGGGLSAPITQTVTVGTTNSRLEFIETPGAPSTPGGTNGVTSAQHAADVAFVTQLYVSYLKRQPGAAEISTYSTMLDDGTSTQASLTTMVKTSQEYRNVCTIWLQRLYTDVLGRSIQSSEESNWLAYLQGSGTMNAVADSVSMSAASQQQQWASYVQSVYQTYLNRSASTSEVANWITDFQAGFTEAGLVSVVVTSGEFLSRVGSSNTQFVAALYQDMLGRTGGPSEIASWVSLLSSGGASLATVVAGFLGSAEYQARQNTLWVASLYNTLLGRAAGAQELTAVDAELSSGTSRETIEDGVLTSQEYYNRAATLAGA